MGAIEVMTPSLEVLGTSLPSLVRYILVVKTTFRTKRAPSQNFRVLFQACIGPSQICGTYRPLRAPKAHIGPLKSGMYPLMSGMALPDLEYAFSGLEWFA